MRSEGYSSRRVCLSVCLCVCLAVKSNLTSGASVRRENAATYSACNEGQKICGVFSETTPFQSYGTSGIVRLPCNRPFFSVKYARALLKCHVDRVAGFMQ